MPSTTPEPRPGLPETIGLCLSGGGFRAAFYHLGALDYLDRVGLVDRVTAVSTVSGGSFTGAAWLASRAEKRGFSSFFQRFFDRLGGIELVKAWMARLNDPPADVPSGALKVIIAAAGAYDSALFRKADGHGWRLGDLRRALDGDMEVVVFNTTEFVWGTDFRFGWARKLPWAGSDRIRIPKEALDEVRLADAVAASSCFPGGFEPIEFPVDFAWRDGVPAALHFSLLDAVEGGIVPLMDGGIYDNQGIDTITQAHELVESGLDLVIVSDSEPEEGGYYASPEVGTGGWRLEQLDMALLAFVVACFFVAIMEAMGLVHHLRTEADPIFSVSLLLGLSAGLGLTMGLAAVILRQKAFAALGAVPQMSTEAAWSVIRQLTVRELTGLAVQRLASLYTMSSSVFLSRIRHMSYRALRRDPVMKGRVVLNLFEEVLEPRGKDQSFLAPGPNVCGVVRGASRMGTTLWWTRPGERRELVAAAHATMCRSLARWVTRTWEEPRPPDVEHLLARLLEDWARLEQDPLSLLEERHPDLGPKLRMPEGID